MILMFMRHADDDDADVCILTSIGVCVYIYLVRDAGDAVRCVT